MSLVQSELVFSFSAFFKAVFVSLPIVFYLILQRKNARVIEVLMCGFLFLSHFFFGVFSSFFFFWIQVFLMVLALAPKSAKDSRLYRTELIRCLASGLCFLVGLIFSSHLSQISLGLDSNRSDLAHSTIALTSVLFGVMIQVFRWDSKNLKAPYLGDCILVYTSFEMLFVFFDDFAQFRGMTILAAMSFMLTLTFFLFQELKFPTLNHSKSWYPLVGSLIFINLLLKEKTQLELFAMGWFFIVSYESLLRPQLKGLRSRVWIQIFLRALLFFGVFGFFRSLFLLLSEVVEKDLVLVSIFYGHFFTILFFGFLWLWKQDMVDPSDHIRKKFDLRIGLCLVFVLLMNPVILLGNFPISSELLVEFGHSIFSEEVTKFSAGYDASSLLWQFGLVFSAIVLSFGVNKIRKVSPLNVDSKSRRRRPGTLVGFEYYFLKITTLVNIPRIRSFSLPSLHFMDGKGKDWENHEIQIGLLVIFLVFIWFLFGKGLA